MNRIRFQTPDLLKGIAVILMVQVHLTELFATSEIYTSWPGKISLFLGGIPAAPVFMAVMGYFIAMSSHPLKTQILRGIKLLALGFALNIGLNLNVLINIFNGTYLLNPYHFIFGVDILFVAGLSIIFIALFRTFFKERVSFWITLIVIFATLNQFLPVYSGDMPWVRFLQAYFWGYFSWSYFPVFPWIAYVLLGYVFYLLEQKHKLSGLSKQFKLYTAIVLILILGSTFTYGFEISTILDAYYHHDFIYFLWALGFMLLWVLAVQYLDSKFGENPALVFLKWTGKNVTAFYVVQWLIIGNIGTTIYKTQEMWTLPLWFAGILILSSLLVWAYARIKKGVS